MYDDSHQAHVRAPKTLLGHLEVSVESKFEFECNSHFFHTLFVLNHLLNQLDDSMIDHATGRFVAGGSMPLEWISDETVHQFKSTYCKSSAYSLSLA